MSKPASPKFVEGTGRVMNTIPPSDFSYWEMLNEAVQAQPAEAMDPGDRRADRRGRHREGKALQSRCPDEEDPDRGRSPWGMPPVRAVSLAARASEGFGYYGASSKWINGLFSGGYEFLTPPPEMTKEGVKPYPSDGARKLNARIWFFYSVTGITPAMCMRLENVGSQYLDGRQGQPGQSLRRQQDLQGHAPAQDPCRAVLVVHRCTTTRRRSMLDTPQRYPRAGSQTYPSPAAEANADGSTTVYFGPTQPAGVKRGNWIQTDPKKGWFAILRLYSPLQPFFSKEWRAGEIELVK